MRTGKGNTLEFLAERFPELPIPKFTRVPATVPEGSWRTLFRDPIHTFTRGLQNPFIVRSDDPLEDGLGRSFAGLRDSQKVLRPEHLRDTYERISSPRDSLEIQQYARMRGVDYTHGRIPVLFQEYVESTLVGSLLRHPNNNSILVDLLFPHSKKVQNAVALQLWDGQEYSDREIAKLILKGTTILNRCYAESFLENGGAKEIAVAISNFRTVETEFPGIACQNEVTFGPYSFLQWRGLCEQEHSLKSLDEYAVSDDVAEVIPVPLAFGNVQTAPILLFSATKTVAESMYFRHFPARRVNAVVDLAARIGPSAKRVGVAYDELYGWLPEIEGPFVKAMDVALFSKINGGCSSYHQELRAVPQLQAHTAFRFLELGLPSGFTNQQLYGCDGKMMRYVAAGGEGRIEILKES